MIREIDHRVVADDGSIVKAPFHPYHSATYNMFVSWVAMGRLSCEPFGVPYFTFGLLRRLSQVSSDLSIDLDDHVLLATMERMVR